MVAKTFDTIQPSVNISRGEPRSDMFAQSSALYSRINKKSKTSPWLIAAPAALLVLVGGAVLVSTGKPAQRTTTATQTTSRHNEHGRPGRHDAGAGENRPCESRGGARRQGYASAGKGGSGSTCGQPVAGNSDSFRPRAGRARTFGLYERKARSARRGNPGSRRGNDAARHRHGSAGAEHARSGRYNAGARAHHVGAG